MGVAEQAPTMQQPAFALSLALASCALAQDAAGPPFRCPEKNGFFPDLEQCPDGETIGPNGQPLAHPSFPHPTSCRKYINCQFGVNPVELGCTDGLIFDHTINKCVNPEEGPSECKCWYSCDDTSCPDTCNTDCTCP